MRTISSEELRLNHSNLIRRFKMGELSLGKMAKLLEIEKIELRKTLSVLDIPIINESVGEAVDEANRLLTTL